MIPAKSRQRAVRRVPTEAEFRAIVAEIRHPNWPTPNPRTPGGQRPLTQDDAADFAEYLGVAGVGQAEASSLEWADVDWERNVVNYTRQKTGKPFSHPIYAWHQPLLKRMRDASETKTGRLWKAGVDVKVIALWQGHSDGGKLIMDTYTEVFGSNDEDYQRQQLAKAEGKIVEFAAA